jgi:hypothetical protein
MSNSDVLTTIMPDQHGRKNANKHGIQRDAAYGPLQHGSNRALHHLPPIAAAGLAHLPALALAAFMLTTGASLTTVILVEGIAAALVAWFLQLPVWWRYINLLFVPLLWAGMHIEVQSHWYLLGFIVLAVTSLGAVRTRVPLYLSSQQASIELGARLPENCALVDLGCGLGGPLKHLSTLRPDLHLHGIEAAPLNWLFSRIRLGKRANIQLGSLWNTNLSGFDAAYAYLSPAPMARLWAKAKAEMKPGSLFISNSFAVPGIPPHETIELNDLSHARLYIWRL